MRSRQAAAAMTIVIGPDSDAEERYLDAFSYAERCHLTSLRKRGCAILMAPSIAIGLDSMPAAKRRGRTLSTGEQAENQVIYGPGSGVIAIYEPTIDVLVLPTGRATLDPEHAVLHELGHALTYKAIGALDPVPLMRSLPPEIARHIAQPSYRGNAHSELAEVMAEAYAWTVVGRMEELGFAITSALQAILPGDVEFFEDAL
jgi:hypothetical protein